MTTAQDGCASAPRKRPHLVLQEFAPQHPVDAAPPPPQRRIPKASGPCDDLTTIAHMLEGVRSQILSYHAASAAMHQDMAVMRDQVARASVQVAERDASIDRAYEAAAGLRAIVDGVRRRVADMQSIKGVVEDRVLTIGSVLSDMIDIKGRLATKIAKLEEAAADLADARKAAEAEMERLHSAHQSQIGAMQQEAEAQSREMDQMRKSAAQLETDLAGAQCQIVALEQQVRDSRKELAELKERSAGEIADALAGARGLVQTAAATLGCREPPSFGDGRLPALQVALTDVLAEHCSATRCAIDAEREAREEAAKERDAAAEHAKELSAMLETSKQECAEHAANNEKMNEHRERLIQRMMDQQREIGSALARLADMQRLRNVANTVASVLGLGANSQDRLSTIDYEDLQVMLQERVSHANCAVAQQTLTAERDALQCRVTDLETKIAGLMAQMQAPRPTCPAGRHVEPAPKTAPLRSRAKRCTPVPGAMRGGMVSSVAASVRKVSGTDSLPASPSRRRAADPGASEMDIWAVFSKP